eukprot:TRINITY_DN15_c0_g1_i1.p1 TRINITY_DN15_c0_g1~~TRINITY_DN15_c0_g1_i1.p1  ORF type:complete len:162 (+),score=13.13 TRINITY_DN15_c0_g1_i1:65-550(+)
MPHSYGYRARTRSLFSRPFRGRGTIPLSTFLEVFKRGDLVDVVCNGSVQKGMPHKYYHGKTGRVFDVNRRSVGVVINKTVGNRQIPKRIYVRIEHVKHSNSRLDFLKRVKSNEDKRKKAKELNQKVGSLKRTPTLPKPGRLVKVRKTEIVTVKPIKYEFLV